MSLSGARGLVRIATNLEGELQAAMVADRYNETKLYRDITGQDYPREYGERLSARRRGAKFEANLYQNDASLLRRSVGPLYGHNPSTMWVRNFLEELPGGKDDRRALRASRFRQIMRDLAIGRRVPDLIVQPQLLLAGAAAGDIRFISPDFAILDPRSQVYVPGEVKSFIVRDAGPNPGDLGPTRLQAAAQIIALRGEALRLGIAGRVTARAVFVFSTPGYLLPTPGIEEGLKAEVDMIGRAIAKLVETGRVLSQLRAPDAAALPDLVSELRSHYQESCIRTCALADICRQQYVGRAAALGDDVADLLGADSDLHRVLQLANGAIPADEHEAEIALAFREAICALDLGDTVPFKRTA